MDGSLVFVSRKRPGDVKLRRDGSKRRDVSCIARDQSERPSTGVCSMNRGQDDWKQVTQARVQM